MAENKENKTQQMTKAQEEVARLLNNSMGLIPSATVWDIYSRDIEKTVTRRLEKGGINTDSIIVRCILTSNVGASRHLSRAAESTNLPFLVVVFKTLVADDDYENISLKKKINSYDEYVKYMKYYNELFYYVMDINKRFKKYTDVRDCK